MTTLNRLLIRERLNLLVLLPLAVVLLLTVPFVADRVEDARDSTDTERLVTTAREVNGLIQELEHERALAVAHLAVGEEVGEGAHFIEHAHLTSRAQDVVEEVSDIRIALQQQPSARIDAALRTLDGLPRLRERVLQHAIGANDVLRSYSDVIGGLIDALGLAQGVGAGTPGGRQQTALDALLRAGEERSRAGAGMLAVLADPGRQAQGLTDIGTSVRLERLQIGRFRQLATPDQTKMFNAAAAGQVASQVNAFQSTLAGQAALPAERRGQRAAEIVAALDTEALLRGLVQDRIGRDIAHEAQAAAGKARLAAFGFAALAILMFVLVALLNVVVGRSIARPLRRLTLAAGQVADLAQSELVRVTDEEAEAEQPIRLAAIEVYGDDEVGELAAALNRVQATAALLVERQVTSRRNIASMFGSVGRRTQGLVGRQLAQIDGLERDEQDPEVLARLYRLDHVTARLRRHADSLVVLSGAPEPSLASVPLPISNVIRAAFAEIEEYQRLRMIGIDDVPVVPDVALDLKLLIAELLENATAFSPPYTEVEVSGQYAEYGYRIVVADHGMGMPVERLAAENERFIRRERLDLAPPDVLGLFIVGRLCRRHGIDLVLRATPGGGVTADLTLPDELIATSAGADAESADVSRLPAPRPARDGAYGSGDGRQSLPGQPGELPGLGTGQAAPLSRRQPAAGAGAGQGAGRRPDAGRGDPGRPMIIAAGSQARDRADVPETGGLQEGEVDDAMIELIEQFEAGEMHGLRSRDRGHGNHGTGTDDESASYAVPSFARDLDRELQRTLENLVSHPRMSAPQAPVEPPLRPDGLPPVAAGQDPGEPGGYGGIRHDGGPDGGARGDGAGADGGNGGPARSPEGLVRRVPGAQLPVTPPAAPQPHLDLQAADPEAARAAVEEFEAGVSRAMQAAREFPDLPLPYDSAPPEPLSDPADSAERADSAESSRSAASSESTEVAPAEPVADSGERDK